MKTTTTILKPNVKAIEFIRKDIAEKKERQKKMMETIDPNIVKTLKRMKKIGR